MSDVDEFEDVQVVWAVDTPSGKTLELLTEQEKLTYEHMATTYLEDNALPNAADLGTLDQILFNELMCYRWSQWVASEQDYNGEPVTLAAYQKSIMDYNKVCMDLKKTLGIDKASRNRDKSDSVYDYIMNLLQRAETFGVKRNTEAVEAITLWKQLVAKVQFWRNCDEDERKEFRAQAEDVMDWILSKEEEFEEIDRLFRVEQKIWRQELER